MVAILPLDLRDAYRLWQRSMTQLRVAFGGPIGLDYVAVGLVARAISVRLTDETLEGLQALENEYLAWHNEEAKRREAKRKAHDEAKRQLERMR